MRTTIWLSANTTWYIVNFRQRLMSRLLERGYDVVVLAPSDSSCEHLRRNGIEHVDLVLDNAGTNLVRESALLYRLARLFRRRRPSVLLTFTPKINIYAALAAGSAGIPVICNISGLGSGFLRGGTLARVMNVLYRLALRRAAWVFFQNDDDLRLFVLTRLVSGHKVERLPGSGVDIERFAPPPALSSAREAFVFLLVARMLRDKGVYEFVEAARALRKERADVQFVMVGPHGYQNPSAIPVEQLLEWDRDGVVRYMGSTDDPVTVYRGADCVVLPSYREGMSRVLLEAASMALPVVTTDVPGCRDVVEDNVTGFVCRPKDSADLAEKMRAMLRLDSSQRARMGRLAREKVVEQFDEEVVLQKYIQRIDAVLNRCGSSAAT